MKRPDFLRSLCVEDDNSAGDAENVIPVELPPDGRLYGIELAAPSGHAGVTLQLQDSEFILRPEDCSLHFDLPGLVLPAYTRLVTRNGTHSRLTLIYGHCAA